MRFYLQQSLHVGSTIDLSDEVIRHLQVLRLQPGAKITLFNGDGCDYRAELHSLEKRRAQARVSERLAGLAESPLRLHLALVMSKGDRLDWALQKATELGVHAIHLLSSERCEVRLREEDRRERKLQHWRQILISACEQCGRSVLPELSAPLSLVEHLRTHSRPGYILDPRADAALAAPPEHAEIELLVGPEGGFSAAELRLAEEHAYRGLRLGPRILRTETAPLVALSILQHRYGDLG